MQKVKDLLNKNWFIFILLFVLGFLCFGNVINGNLFFDDNLLIRSNHHIKSLSNIPKLFFTNTNDGAWLKASEFYRPMQSFLFTLVYAVTKTEPWLYHLISILLHIANSFCVFYLLHKLSFHRISALLAAVIFLVHPVQTEAVSYISGLADPLSLFFIFLSIIFFENSCQSDRQISKRKILLSVLFFLFALLSKEMAVIAPVLISVVVIFRFANYSSSEKRIKMVSLGILFSISALYLVLRATVLNFTGHIGVVHEDNIYIQSLPLRLSTFLCIIWEYFKLFFAPIDLYLEKPYSAYAADFLLKARGLFGIAAILVGISVSLFSYLKGQKKIFLACMWILFAMIPIAGILPLNAMYLEHWLYFPMFGIVALFASLSDWLLENDRLAKIDVYREIFYGILLAFILALAMRTIARNFEWANPIKFYENEIKHMSPYQPSARIFNNLAMEYATIKDYQKSIQNYNKSILIWDVFPQSHYNLANAYLETGHPEMAYEELFKALEKDPNFIYAQLSLVKFYYAHGQKDKAVYMSKIAVRTQNGEKINYSEIAKLK